MVQAHVGHTLCVVRGCLCSACVLCVLPWSIWQAKRARFSRKRPAAACDPVDSQVLKRPAATQPPPEISEASDPADGSQQEHQEVPLGFRHAPEGEGTEEVEEISPPPSPMPGCFSEDRMHACLQCFTRVPKLTESRSVGQWAMATGDRRQAMMIEAT